MITREQIEEIQTVSWEKGISIKKLLEEKGIPAHRIRILAVTITRLFLHQGAQVKVL